MIKHKLLQISSRDRDLAASASTSDFIVTLNNSEGLQACKSVVVKAITLPNVFYNISSLDGNDKFTYAIAGVPTTITIPEGQYTITTLLSALEASASAIGLNATFDGLNYKVSFTTTTAIEFLDLSQGNGMAEVLGIEINGGSGGDVLSFAATGIVSLEGVRNVYVESSILGESNLIRSNNTTSSMLAVVPITVPFGATEHYISQHSEIDDVDAVSKRYGKNIQKIDIKLRDHDGHVLSLAGHHVTLIIKIYY